MNGRMVENANHSQTALARPDQLVDAGAPTSGTSKSRLRQTVHSPLAAVGSALLLILLLIAAIGPTVWSVDPLHQSLVARNKPPGWVDPTSGQHHYLGTDQVGRDMMARLIRATRVSLEVGTLSVLGAALLGVLAAGVAGYRGGLTDTIAMRAVDVQMSFPFILVAIIWASIAGSGAGSIIVIVSLFGWTAYARIVRGRILAIRGLAYVEAARAIGATPLRVLVRHVLPQTMSSIIILSALQLGGAVIFESTLSFLGLGIQPPTPTLGNMLADGRDYLQSAWWLVICPGTLLTIIVISVNLLGDGLRDILDPQTTRSGR